MTAFHKDLKTLHVGCEKPRAYYIPFDSEDKALYEREKSPFFKSLCGEWNFRFCESFEDISWDFTEKTFDALDFDKIKVPMCWQMNLGRGYDVPLYSNERYAFPKDPPYVPDRNPCGIYISDFELDSVFASKKIFLNFEGVASGFYVYINGKFVGYSQVSHCTSEFDVSGFVSEGRNRIAVLVVKWCDGSYLECQDSYRLSGIFREVYLLARSEKRINDIFITSEVDGDMLSATVCVDAELINTDSFGYRLVSPDGKTEAEGTSGEKLKIRVDRPELWSDETPAQYSLFFTVGDEVILIKYGIKKLEIKSSVLLLNGKPVKARGVNRHDSNPVYGYTVSVQDMINDINLMKRANVNCVRTSHYPNDPRFLQLCSDSGLMVVDEADIETHGMGRNPDGIWDWPCWSSLSDGKDWEEAYVDRAARLFERDKNNACVIMWSLGNEAGVGNNHRAMRRYIKGRNENAIVHYENSHKEFPCVPEGEDYSDISDVESRMYAGVEYQRQYLADKSNKKPFFLCEYVDSVTTGDVYANWDIVEEFEGHFGGCIWEFCDHAVLMYENGKKKYCYGGDFNEYPNDSIGCIDGLVYPDRTPRPGYYDMKKVYEQFGASYENGAVTIKNKRYFTTLGDMYIRWSVDCDGKTVLSGRTAALDIEPQTYRSYKLFDDDAQKLCGKCYLNLSMRYISDLPWAEKDYETGFAQFELEANDGKKQTVRENNIVCDDGERIVTVSCGDVRYTFDKVYGELNSISLCGKELISAPFALNFWKAREYNSFGLEERWKKADLNRLFKKCYGCEVKANAESAVIKCRFSLAGPSLPPEIMGEETYTFGRDGSVSFGVSASLHEKMPELPRIGLRIITSDGFENAVYFGMGPQEAYVDRHKAARMGLYASKIDELFEHYIRPQENGAHYGTLYAAVTNDDGQGLRFSSCDGSAFSFKASHYTEQMISETMHDSELKPIPQTVVSLDYRILPASGNGEIAKIEKERVFDCRSFDFSFKITPLLIENSEE